MVIATYLPTFHDTYVSCLVTVRSTCEIRIRTTCLQPATRLLSNYVLSSKSRNFTLIECQMMPRATTKLLARTTVAYSFVTRTLPQRGASIKSVTWGPSPVGSGVSMTRSPQIVTELYVTAVPGGTIKLASPKNLIITMLIRPEGR